MQKSKKTEITKERIINAAMEEFGTKGYTAASLNNICNTGISKGLLYHNFENKDAIYLACVRQCFTQLTAYLLKQGNEISLSGYMEARQNFFQKYPYLAKLFFESVLQPPVHIEKEVKELQKDFNMLNRNFFKNLLEKIPLRAGVTMADAMDYFILMQNTFHGYFIGSLCFEMSFPEIMDTHEASLSKLLDYMLYGIAERRVTE